MATQIKNSKEEDKNETFIGGELAFAQDALFAEVIIPLALPMNYTWSIPAEFAEATMPGLRVEVSLKNKRYAGIIKNICQKAPANFKAKPILNILDEEPLVFPGQLKFWAWMAHYYMCSEGEVMQAAIPANFKLSGESILQFNETYDGDAATLSNDEFLLLEALEIKKEIRMGEVQQILDKAHVYPVVKKLIEKEVCFIRENLKEKYKPKTELHIRLHPEFQDEKKLENLLDEWTKAPKQLALLLSFLHLSRNSTEVQQAELLKKSNASAAQLKALVDKNILVSLKTNVDRVQLLPPKMNIDFTLSGAQEIALAEINTIFAEKEVCLLQGVTSSGKTEVYTKLMESHIRQGKQILYMLPEIALTSQLIRRLQKNFGGHIIVYHSKFNPQERVEIWNRVKSGQAHIIVGARSALFLPFKNLALIIVDEEHDASYKQQEPAPRYHARDAAIYLAADCNAKVLLGSATPSMESLYNAEKGKYGRVILNERYGKVNMPAIEIIDVKKIIQKEKGKVIISPQLKASIATAIEEKKQVIVFQNRRGYSPYFICGSCGWIPQCTDCAVTLTFHKSKNQLCCHYCGKVYPVIYTCGACGSHSFIKKNFGTEKIEEMLAEAFPGVHTARMDYDSVKGKYDHDNLIKLFEQKKIDILVGTQMVVKGLDFENVNLVGILDADSLLHFADFRVNERAFQMMQQVSGRAGRKDGQGKVMIQVSNTQHPVIGFLLKHDYEKFYAFEMEARKQFHYPPFSRMIKISIKHTINEIASEAASRMAIGLQKNYQAYISGPAEAIIPRIRNRYIWELVIKLPRNISLIEQCKIEILQQAAILFSYKRYASVTIQPDVDPV